MIDGVNDTNNHLIALCNYISDLHCHVNLIPLNNCPIKTFKALVFLSDFSIIPFC